MHPLICCTVSRENQSSKGEATSSGEQSTGEATGQPRPNRIKGLASELNNIKASNSKKKQSSNGGLLVQCIPNEEGEKVECAKGLPLTVWCCKVVFILEHECTLVFCMACKEKSDCHQWSQQRKKGAAAILSGFGQLCNKLSLCWKLKQVNLLGSI